MKKALQLMFLLTFVCFVATPGASMADFAPAAFTHATVQTITSVLREPASVNACGTDNITHSSTQTITPGSISCNSGGFHVNNSYWRAFKLADFGVTDNFTVCKVEIGVELAEGGAQPLQVRLYTSNQPFPNGYPGSLTLIGTDNATVVDNQTATVISLPVTGTAPAWAELVVEIFTPNGQATNKKFFIGSNAASETGPSYLLAADCGVTIPSTLASIGFPNMHIVMNVVGSICFDADNDTYGEGCSAGPDCDDNDSAIHNTVTYYPDADSDDYGNADNASQFCSLTPPEGYTTDNSDCDDTDDFYTDICPDCTVKIIPKTLGWLVGDKEKNRTLLVIGAKGTEFGDNPVIKWESDAIDVIKTRVFFKRFMFMRAKFNGEPLEKQEYRVLVGDCEGSIKWAK